MQYQPINVTSEKGKRLTMVQLGWLVALLPAAAFVWIWQLLGSVTNEQVLTTQLSWLPSMGLSVGFYLDSLSGVFALLVLGIGSLVFVYTGYYFQGDSSAWRFFLYLGLFMVGMTGLVLAGDVLTLFIFWESTTIFSFLLVAYKTKDAKARRGAFNAFLVTAGGGVALLIGLLLISQVTGSTQWTTILISGNLLHNHPLYPVMLGLVALGAFTKSAQFPFHGWLPGAMSAPTPASAYLHSATMVKAGIYLMARLNPALGQINPSLPMPDLWFWLLTSVGMITMVLGAYLGLKQNDLKALLAYSTISQLGVLMMLIGQDTEIAFKALVIGIVAHAFYKSALFLVVGIIDHETGTRDLRLLGGLRQQMPWLFGVTAFAALSMAGLPPLFGFLAKETLLATAVHPTLPTGLNWILAIAVIVAAAMKLVQSGLVVGDAFMGQPTEAVLRSHEAPKAMWLMPAIPAVLSLALGILPEPAFVAKRLAYAAEAAHASSVKVSLALWTGLNIPLFLSLIAIGMGAVLFRYRRPLRVWMIAHDSTVTTAQLGQVVMRSFDGAAALALRLQNGRLRDYVSIIIVMAVALVIGFTRFDVPLLQQGLNDVGWNFATELQFLRLFALLMTCGAAIATVVLRRDLFAIFAFGLSGLGLAAYLILEPAPDVALVQIVVDLLAMVILVLALTRLPRQQRRETQRLNRTQSRLGLVRDWVVAGSLGSVVSVSTFVALTTRPRPKIVTSFYEANAKVLTGAKDVVGAILVDYRAIDTLIEIVVFSLAGLGLYTLLRFANDPQEREAWGANLRILPTKGIVGEEKSIFIKTLAFVTLPFALVLAITHMMYGHDQPGDGFTAGIIIGLSVGFWYVVLGYEETRQRLWWLRPYNLIASGLLLVLLSGGIAAVVTGSFLGHVDFGKAMGLPLPTGFALSTAFLFEVAICLAVLGSVSHMLNVLAHGVSEPADTAVGGS